MRFTVGNKSFVAVHFWWCSVEAAEPAAHVDPARRDPQSLGIPSESHRLLEIAVRFPQLAQSVLTGVFFVGRIVHYMTGIDRHFCIERIG